MEDMRKRTVELLTGHGALRFGDFTLKSGRKSPYFINLGDIADGSGLAGLGEILAHKISRDIGFDFFDVLFGPAYKGIPLASVTSAAMFSIYRVSKGFAYDRKEKKAHGEGGNFIGTSLTGTSRRVLLIDDVITDGGTKIDTIRLIEGETASKVVAILTVVDRMEQTEDGTLFSSIIGKQTGIPVHSVISLSDIVAHIAEHGPQSLGIGAEAWDELRKRA